MGIVSAANLVGEVLGGRYRVLRRLGTGGMGTVYLAEHVLLGRLSAVKVLCPPLCEDDPRAEQRFRQEALLVASVRHPGIAQVYDFDRGPDARFLLAMEYVEAETVAQRLRRDGPFPLPEAIGVLRIVADALNHVHWMGILHRDLKPQNIMLGSGGVVKLLDFGVAHEMAQLPAPDACQSGTLAYMSPDQLLGDALGPASDIFSLGVVFYEMLTNRLPTQARRLLSFEPSACCARPRPCTGSARSSLAHWGRWSRGPSIPTRPSAGRRRWRSRRRRRGRSEPKAVRRFVNPRRERARSAWCAPLQGALCAEPGLSARETYDANSLN